MALPSLTLRPLVGAGPINLRVPTPESWLPQALEQFDLVLIDHAHCEKKAAANALSLLQSYPDIKGLPAQMARLAREESAHLARVLALMEERGLTLTRDGGDPYAQKLQELIRTPFKARQLDRLLVAGIIEARSCERLGLLATGLSHVNLKLASFYKELAQSEDGHQSLFYRLAGEIETTAIIDERLSQLLDSEAELLRTLPVRPAIH
jgi:tRNA 2-(methylsulfanyl)-N6-isopentenyladenosine37 hydroxylase